MCRVYVLLSCGAGSLFSSRRPDRRSSFYERSRRQIKNHGKLSHGLLNHMQDKLSSSGAINVVLFRQPLSRSHWVQGADRFSESMTRFHPSPQHNFSRRPCGPLGDTLSCWRQPLSAAPGSEKTLDRASCQGRSGCVVGSSRMFRVEGKAKAALVKLVQDDGANCKSLQ